MDELIDRAALRHNAANVPMHGDCEQFYAILGEVARVIDAAPTVDAEPVVHARWIQHDLRVIQSECSACRTSFNVRMEYGLSTKYCPSCGAKMDGEKETEHETD